MDDPVFTSAVLYQDPKTAVQWLERASSFEVTMAMEGPPGARRWAIRDELPGEGRIMLGGQWDEWVTSPAGGGGKNT